MTKDRLSGERLVFVGKLAGANRKEAKQLARQEGAVVQDRVDHSTTLVVVGEAELPIAGPADLAALSATETSATSDQSDDSTSRNPAEVISESQFWQRLGLVESQQNVQRLYTPAMLSDLVGVPLAIIRRWHRRGLILPVREVRRLPYFDFQEVVTARQLAALLADGISPGTLEKQLGELARRLPSIERPLAQLSVIVEGKHLLLRQGEGLVDPGGQLRFNFDAQQTLDRQAEGLPTDPAQTNLLMSSELSPSEMVSRAAELEDQGELEAAVDLYRASLAALGPDAELCFRLGELLYRLGQTQAACERYYMAIELDADFVEARANLGCVLAELGQVELAVSAFEGALASHPDFPDAHFHLARALDELGRSDEAAVHWRRFLELVDTSPWADEARRRLSQPTE